MIGQFAVGLALVGREAGRSGGDLPPCLLPLGSVQLLGGHRDRAAAQLDFHLIGMRGDVVIPGRVPRRPGRRHHDQPAAIGAGKPAHRIGALCPALGADGRQDQSAKA